MIRRSVMKIGDKFNKIGSILVFILIFLISCSTNDVHPPIPGNAGTLLLEGVTETEVTVIWSKAVDLTSEEAMLEYKLVYSETPNLETPEKAEANGTTAVDWTSGITTGTVTGLSAYTEYHFNVVVRDEAGNVAAYLTAATETADATAPVPGNSGIITVSDVGKTSLHLEWENGSDGRTPTYALEYKGVYSTSDNISTAADAETNGTVIFDWTPDVDSITVTGLSEGTEYFFNVLIQDTDENSVPYTAVSAETFEPLLLVGDEAEGKMKAITLDGSESYTVFDNSVLNIDPTGIAVDAGNGVVYWTEFNYNRIMKGNLDGTGIDVLLEGSDVNLPIYLELDPDDGILYWVNRGDESIKRVNTAGSVVETVYTDTDRLDFTLGLELDFTNHIIYWSNRGITNGLFQINTDGSGFTEIVTSPDVVSPYGIALDKVNETLYWAESTDIKKVNTDGTGIADVVTSGITSPRGVYYYNEILYFTDASDGKVYAYTDTPLELDDDFTYPSDLEIWDID
jgi:chitodextrinase